MGSECWGRGSGRAHLRCVVMNLKFTIKFKTLIKTISRCPFALKALTVIDNWLLKKKKGGGGISNYLSLRKWHLSKVALSNFFESELCLEKMVTRAHTDWGVTINHTFHTRIDLVPTTVSTVIIQPSLLQKSCSCLFSWCPVKFSICLGLFILTQNTY